MLPLGRVRHAVGTALALGFASATGCHTTRIETCWIDPGNGRPPAVTNLLVVATMFQPTIRTPLESALAAELSGHGAQAEPSIGKVVLESFLADPEGLARDWTSRTHQSLLVVRTLNGETRIESKDRRGIYDTGETDLPVHVSKPRERSMNDSIAMHAQAASGMPRVVPGFTMIEETWSSEVTLLHPATGKPVWSVQASTPVREGNDPARWMAAFARAVVRRLDRDGLLPRTRPGGE